MTDFIQELETLIQDRKVHLPESSYTTTLFNGGVDLILKKIAEESGEVIIAAKNKNKKELTHESADLIYHLLVLLTELDLSFKDVSAELENRHATS